MLSDGRQVTAMPDACYCGLAVRACAQLEYAAVIGRADPKTSLQALTTLVRQQTLQVKQASAAAATPSAGFETAVACLNEVRTCAVRPMLVVAGGKPPTPHSSTVAGVDGCCRNCSG